MSGFSITKAKKEHMITPCEHSVGHQMSRAAASNQRCLLSQCTLCTLYEFGLTQDTRAGEQSQISPVLHKPVEQSIHKKSSCLFHIPKATMKSDFTTLLYHQYWAFHYTDVFISWFINTPAVS